MKCVAASAALFVCFSTSAFAQTVPNRVVSINLCTDQMAMQIAAPGQLKSVSYLAASDPSSAMAEQARAYPANHALAEEIFLMQPDLVLASTWSNPSTVGLLRQLGVRVEQFAPEEKFADIRTNYLRMGEMLGQPARAAEIVAGMDSELAALAGKPASGKTIAAYHANSYTVGSGTLLNAVMEMSGLTNIASKLGIQGVARIPLETLILAQPDLIADGDREYRAPALAQQNFVHPAYRALLAHSRPVDVSGRYTICGTPFTIEAAKRLREAADAP